MPTRTSSPLPHADYFPPERAEPAPGRIVRFVIDDLSEVASFAQVIRNFVVQELRVRYNHSLLGFFWSLLNPLLMMATLTAIFSQLMATQWRSYAFHLLSGMVPWGFLSGSVSECATAFVANGHLIRKIYVPKLVFPLSRVLLNLVTFVLSLGALYLLLAPLGAKLTPSMLALPLAIALFFGFVLGISVAIATINTFYRDCGHLIGVVLQAWYFFTPILYEPSNFPTLAQLQWANPAYPFIRIFQFIIRDGAWPGAGLWVAASGLALVSVGVGYAALKSSEEKLVFRI
jgi:ABC-2 type transport system permease protein/lipopolysaccharide transport system permease protein